MKKLKKAFVVFLAFFIGIINVSALVLKDGNSSYVINEINIDCGEEVFWAGSTKEEKSVLLGMETDTHYWINDDNTCIKMTPSELLKYSSDINFTEVNYYIDKNDQDEYIIMESTTKYVDELYIKTEDNTLQDKEYYVVDMTSSTHELKLVEEPSELDLSNYYEKKYVTVPSSASLEESPYYVRVQGENYIIEEVKQEDLNEEDILYYYVETNERTKTTEREVLKLDSTIFASLIESSEGSYPFYNYNTNSYYIDFAWEDDYYSTYRQDGVQIGPKSKNYVYPLVEDLYVKIVRDEEDIREGFEIYNLKNELLYEGLGMLYLENYKNDKGLLYIENTEDLSLKYYEFITNAETLPNTPNTFDGVGYYIALALISLAGITFTTVYLKKHN